MCVCVCCPTVGGEKQFDPVGGGDLSVRLDRGDVVLRPVDQVHSRGVHHLPPQGHRVHADSFQIHLRIRLKEINVY